MTITTRARLINHSSQQLDSDYYHQGRFHDIAIRQSLLGSGIIVYKLRGHNNEVDGTRIHYPDLAEFLRDWDSFQIERR